MPTSTMPNTCMCLREARRAAGYQNFGQAGLATHRSQEVIGRHERGDVPLQMTDAIAYARAYHHPEILMAYCGECEIRKELFGECERKKGGLPVTAIRISNRLRQAAHYADLLAQILDDGEVEKSEIDGLQSTMVYLQSIEEVWRELVTDCMALGIAETKKDRPAGPGTVCATSQVNAHHSKLLW